MIPFDDSACSIVKAEAFSPFSVGRALQLNRLPFSDP